MEKLISFFEIPSANFEGAVAFYKKVFNVKINS